MFLRRPINAWQVENQTWLVSEKNRPLVQLLSERYRSGRSGVRIRGRSNWHSVANGSPQLRRFSELLAQALSREDGPHLPLHVSAE